MTAEAAPNILTVMIEDYYQVGAFSRVIPSSHWGRFEARVKGNTETTLDLLDETGCRATFFACGWIADHHPEILAEVARRGHEVACQGYVHHNIRDMTPETFRDDVRRSRDAVEQATGLPVQGFRIGRGWIGPRDLWALGVLAEVGFAYDASLGPIGRAFADKPGWLTVHQHPTEAGPLWEVPVSSLGVAGWSVPISGGNYLRQLPERPLRWAADRWVRRQAAPLVMYFHVWELDADQPSIAAAGRLQRLRHYRNLDAMTARVRRFLEAFPFTGIADHLGLSSDREVAATSTAAEAPAAAVETRRPLTVVIPCYNEETALPYLKRTLERFAATAGAPYDTRFVFVDDGSQDATWTILGEYFGDRADCQLVRHGTNRGVAAAVLTGIEAATTDVVAVIDADCTFDPHQIATMMPLMEDGVDVVSASPMHRLGEVVNVPAWRLALSHGAAFLYRLVLHHKAASYTSCFRIYRREAVAGMTLANEGFCGMAEILGRLDLAGARIVECPAVLEARLLGRSKINTVRTIADHLRLIARLAAARWLGTPLPAGRGAGAR